jgi:hypothetical protein
VYDLMHDRAKAKEQYQAVMALGSDTVQGQQAQKYMKTAYAGH